MIFRPELAELVMAGRKDVTRRACSPNPRSPWYRARCGLRPGRTYAVQPGRGKPAVGRVWIVHVMRTRVGRISHTECEREGFRNFREFRAAWEAINGGWDPETEVWRVEFRRVTPEVQTSG